MPNTAYHGKSGAFHVMDSSSAWQDISKEVQSVSLPFEAPTEETTGFSDTWQEHVIGIKGGTLTVEGNWDDTVTTGTDVIMWGVLGSITEFRWAPGGSSTGRRKYSGSFLVSSYNPNATVRGKLGFTCSGPTTGTVTGSTI